MLSSVHVVVLNLYRMLLKSNRDLYINSPTSLKFRNLGSFLLGDCCRKYSLYSTLSDFRYYTTLSPNYAPNLYAGIELYYRIICIIDLYTLSILKM